MITSITPITVFATNTTYIVDLSGNIEPTLSVGDYLYVGDVIKIEGIKSDNSDYAIRDNDYSFVVYSADKEKKYKKTSNMATEYTIAQSFDDITTCENYWIVANITNNSIEIIVANEYMLTFDLNGGHIKGLSTITGYTNLHKIESFPSEPRRDGYAFTGWFTSATGGEQITTDTVFTKDTTVYAQWEQDASLSTGKYTITLNASDGVLTSNSIYETVDGSLQTMPSAPTRDGYTFTGWFSSSIDGEQITTNTVFTENTTIYAQWKPNTSSSAGKHTINLDANGGVLTSTSIYETVDGKLETMPSEPTRTGYIFTGWFTSATDGEQISTNTVFAKNTTIYAQWKQNTSLSTGKYTITLDANDGVLTSNSTYETVDGSLQTMPSDPTRDGHTFTGWFTSVTGGEQITANTVFTENTTIYAQWEQDTSSSTGKYVITLNANNGGLTSNIKYETVSGKLETIPSDPIRNGYTFAGWFTSATGGEQITTDTVFTEDTIIYAQWEKIGTYTIAFNSDGGNKINSITAKYKETIAEPEIPIKKGYIFDGWYNGNVKFDFTTPITESITLTAKWINNTHTVIFATVGGSSTDSQVVIHGEKAIEPLDPTQEGYVFGGWYNGNTLYNFNTPVTEDIILTAKWYTDVYTVRFYSNGGEKVKSQFVEHGKTAYEPIAPTKDGHIFKGWYNEGTKFDFSSAITEDITLIAIWEAICNVTFNPNNGDEITTQTIKYNTKISPPVIPTKEGYTFNGWYSENTLFNFNTRIKKDINLTAKWVINTYTATFDSNGGSKTNSQTTYHGSTFTQPTPPTKLGYRFVGWYNENTMYNFDSIATKNITLTAKWSLLSSSTSSSLTIMVSGEDLTAYVPVTVSETTATINAQNKELYDILNEKSETGIITIDATSLDAYIDTIELSKEIVKAFRNNYNSCVKYLTIKFDTGNITLDKKAINTIIYQSYNSSVQIGIVEKNINDMNPSQKTSIKDLNVVARYYVFISNDTEYITDLKNGTATIQFKKDVKDTRDVRNFSVWHIHETGIPQIIESKYIGNNYFEAKLSHFFDYLLVYNLDESTYSICKKNTSCPIAKFKDVTTSAWYHDGIHYCLEKDLINGYSADTFGINDNITRGQFVTILWRLEGEPHINSNMKFTDVSSGVYYEEAVRWANAHNIVNGYSSTIFAPNDNITREQIITMLWRYAKYKGYNTTISEPSNILKYNDAHNISDWALSAMQWVCGDSIVNGNNNYLMPQNSATRAEATNIIQRFCINIYKK